MRLRRPSSRQLRLLVPQLLVVAMLLVLPVDGKVLRPLPILLLPPFLDSLPLLLCLNRCSSCPIVMSCMTIYMPRVHHRVRRSLRHRSFDCV